MKYIKTLLLAILFANTSYSQKPKTITIGAIADFPISKKVYYNYGIGAEAALVINTTNVKNFVFTLSALQYQYDYYTPMPLSSGTVFIKSLKKNSFFRLTIGKHFKVYNKLFVNAQAGFGIGSAVGGQSSQIEPTFLIGPALILPIKEKYNAKLHAAIGAFAGGVFVNVGAAFGFKF
jgi:hypothetical protein